MKEQELLASFILAAGMRNAVENYINGYLANKAVEAVFAGNDVAGLRDTKVNVSAAFDALSEEYAPREKPRQVINQVI